MKKGTGFLSYFFCAAILLLFSVSLSAQVVREEIQVGPVEFINYEGPYSTVDTRSQIFDIGNSLGRIINAGQTRAGATGRYFIINSRSDYDGQKLDADIMGLGADAGVDHIRNLRTIIQGYLEGAYNYSPEDAALLALYVTYYNAVYRGDMTYLDARYKNDVMSNITRDRAGLSIRYDEWPGRTLMLIPLGYGGPGSLNAIDTTILADPAVTGQIRVEEQDAGLDTRREMVNLQERQADEANQQAAAQRETIRQEEARIQERQTAEQQSAQQQNPGRTEPGQEQTRTEQEQTRREEEQQQLAEQREQARQTQEAADNLSQAAQEGRQSIADDQQAIIARSEQGSPEPAGVLGVSIATPDSSLGPIVILDSSTWQERRRSGLTTINARTLTEVGGKLIAVAGENRANAAIRLVEINKDTLAMVKQGEDDIAPTSLLWVRGNDLYAIGSSGGSLYLTRFNTNLERQARSTVTVHPHASVNFIDGNLLTQRTDGSALILNPSDLSERRR